MSKVDLKKISTESRNQKTLNIDKVSSFEIAKMINEQDALVSKAVAKELKNIAAAIDICYKSVSQGGRVFYIGAGTSGRLGVLDASEIRPTYGVMEEMFIGLIAGGDIALRNPVEGAEDSKVEAVNQLKKHKLNSKDVVVGIAASGRTPYVIGGLEFAKTKKAKTISIATSSNAAISKIADVAIEAVVGAEAVTGSTRMKSGTAQKMILNIISSATMIKMNKTYSNLMVDVQATNEKLHQRAASIITSLTKATEEEARALIKKANGNVKTAIVMYVKKVDYKKAKDLLEKNKGSLRKVIG